MTSGDLGGQRIHPSLWRTLICATHCAGQSSNCIHRFCQVDNVVFPRSTSFFRKRQLWVFLSIPRNSPKNSYFLCDCYQQFDCDFHAMKIVSYSGWSISLTENFWSIFVYDIFSIFSLTKPLWQSYFAYENSVPFVFDEEKFSDKFQHLVLC